jgi:hypothetical protein
VRTAALAVLLAAACVPARAAAPDSVQAKAEAAREAQIQSCARCHPREYAQWTQGPHAHTKRSFDEHWAKVDDPGSDIPDDMRAFLKTVDPRDSCLPCHAPFATVYGASLPAAWDGQKPLYERPLALRPDDPVLRTGVDCITCHVDASGRVITRADYVRTPGLKPPPGFCDPQPSKTFSNPYNCLSCHGEAVRWDEREFVAGGGKKFPYLRCEACHWEKGPDGRFSHLEIWSGGRDGRDPLTKADIDELAWTVAKGANGPELRVRWPFDFLPHPIVPNSYMWYAFVFEVLGPDGRVAARTKFGITRFTQPSELETALKSFTKTGEKLYSPRPMEVFAPVLPLPAGLPARGTVRLTVLKRKPYYGPDSVERTLYRREAKYSL